MENTNDNSLKGHLITIVILIGFITFIVLSYNHNQNQEISKINIKNDYTKEEICNIAEHYSKREIRRPTEEINGNKVFLTSITDFKCSVSYKTKRTLNTLVEIEYIYMLNGRPFNYNKRHKVTADLLIEASLGGLNVI